MGVTIIYSDDGENRSQSSRSATVAWSFPTNIRNSYHQQVWKRHTENL